MQCTVALPELPPRWYSSCRQEVSSSPPAGVAGVWLSRNVGFNSKGRREKPEGVSVSSQSAARQERTLKCLQGEWEVWLSRELVPVEREAGKHLKGSL